MGISTLLLMLMIIVRASIVACLVFDVVLFAMARFRRDQAGLVAGRRKGVNALGVATQVVSAAALGWPRGSTSPEPACLVMVFCRGSRSEG